MIGQSPSRQNRASFWSDEIWKEIWSFRTAAIVKRRTDSLAKTPGKELNRIIEQKITVPSARFYRMPFARKRKESVK